MSGTLYLISISIGNKEDITHRALRILKEIDLLLCEEYKFGKNFLSSYGLDKTHDLINEHNEKEKSSEIINLLKEGKNIGLISDHGTPLIEDPGAILVKEAIRQNIKITSLPGASSILSGLILSGFNTKKFLYYGLLSPKTEERKKELLNLKNYPYTIIFLDAPYRVLSILKSVAEIFGEERHACLLVNITMDDEQIFRGSIKKIINDVEKEKNKKFEFVFVVEGKNK
jgi:16S rRNA (cytidine1402-2'-O)-methyltransferase